MDIPYETLVPIIATLTGAFKAFKFVREGERGVKLRFGRVIKTPDGKPKIFEPGFTLIIPFVESIVSHHVRQQSYRFPEQRITLKDGLVYRVAGMVIFRVVDVYNALFEISDLNSSIDDLCMTAIKEELEHLNHQDLRAAADMSEKLKKRVEERAKSWGIEILQLSLPECAPTPETANLINAELSVSMKLQGLFDGLRKHDLSIQAVGPNLAAVLVGVPLTVSVPTELNAGVNTRAIADAVARGSQTHPRDADQE
jgi:regulator of protease activity HflC (stomatin/prohibitin superfamily)